MGRHGKKGIFKDPTVSLGARTYNTVFSRTAGAIISSAIAVRWLTPRLQNSQIPLPGFTGPWQMSALSAALGLGMGYGVMHTLAWSRRRMINSLLEHKGWLFNQKATSTKVWGLMLKLLVGPGPHTLHEFEDVMPKLPVPDLKDTCEKYLIAVEPLLTEEEFSRTKQLVEDLLEKDGPTLQNYLIKKARRTKNWLADWWMTNAYLSRRDPIALNVNFFMMGGCIPEVTRNPFARCANVVHDTLDYYDMIRSGRLPPDMVMDMIPTCMDGVRFMLASTRIPGEHTDTLQLYPKSNHVIFISNGVYYKLEMYPVVDGERRRLNKHEIRNQVKLIWQETKDITGELPVAALTTQDRTTWARNRQSVQKMNAEILEAVESSIFIVILGIERPSTVTGMARASLCGEGHNRWFDKSLVLEVWKDYAQGGGNMEHSGTDATHFAVMWEHVLQLEEYGPDGDLRPLKKGQTVRSNLPKPKRLAWNFDADMRRTIEESYTAFKKRSSEMDIIMYHSEFGRSWMKSRRVSPDGFIQMAIQLAYWRMHHSFSKTYEPASHRLFALGRTDNINPVSKESCEFVRIMDDPKATIDQKVQALKAAISFQNKVRLQATAGFGSDRHMLGLYCAALELGMDIPAVFKDKAFSLPMKLSTSQVPTSLGHLGLDLVPDTIAGGFGPACEEGYGVLYCSIGDDMFNFSISSWQSFPETDSTRFSEFLRQAMRDLKDAMDGKDITNSGKPSGSSSANL